MNHKIIPLVFDRSLYRILSQPLLWDTFKTTLFNAMGKSIGFMVPFFIAAWFGISFETDAFFFAYSLIMFLASIFSQSVETLVVPFIAEARAKGERVDELLGRTLGLCTLGLSGLCFVFLWGMKPTLSYVTRFSPDGQRLIFYILIECLPLVVLLVWTSILAGSLNAYRVFGIPALSPALRAILTLVFIFACKDALGVHAIAVGYVIGEILRLGVLFSVVKYLGLFRIRLSLSWDAKFYEFLKASSYQTVGMSVGLLMPILNRIMASWLGRGNVSILEYAERLFLIFPNFLLLGLITTILSHWSTRYYSGGREQIKREVYRVSKWTAILSLLLTLSVLLVRGRIIEFIYGYGTIPIDKINAIETTFSFFLFGLIFHALHHIFIRAHLVKKNTNIILITALLMSISNIGLNLILMRLVGVAGIALSTTLAYGLSLVILWISFHRNF